MSCTTRVIVTDCDVIVQPQNTEVVVKVQECTTMVTIPYCAPDIPPAVPKIPIPENEIVFGDGDDITSSPTIQRTANGLEVAGDGTGTDLLNIGSNTTQNGKFGFNIDSTSAYNVLHRITDEGYIIVVNSDGRAFVVKAEDGKRRMSIDQFGRFTLGEVNSAGTFQMYAGSLGKIWSLFTGSTPNPNGDGIDESLQIVINAQGAPGYDDSLNTFGLQMETNFRAVDEAYEEVYFKWIRAEDGSNWRNMLMTFNDPGGVVLLKTTFLGKFTWHPTADLNGISSAPTSMEIAENGNVAIGTTSDNTLAKLEVLSNVSGRPMLSLGSNSQNPYMSFYTISSGQKPDYATIKMQNIAAGVGNQTGRLLFALIKNGTLDTKFTMHEDGNFGIALTPIHALHIKDSNFIGGAESTSIKIEGAGIGDANGDALMIGFSAVGGTSNILGLGLRLQDGYKYVANYFGTDKMVLQLSTGVLSLSSLTGSGVGSLYASATGEITRKDNIVASAKTPTGTGDTSGEFGQINYDSNFIYVKTATGWKRSALSIF